jgi:ubiquitin carboxyl-terminal hydrolase 8
LKRFSFDGPFRDKLETYVDFPVGSGLDGGLNLFPYLSSVLKNDILNKYYPSETVNINTVNAPCRYELYAISNHYGGLNGGHYTAYVRHTGTKKWYHFDDSRVSELGGSEGIAAEKVKTKAAYSLFYVSTAPS